MHGAGGGGKTRAPVRRSMFPLEGSSKAVKADKGKSGVRDQGGSALEFESDALELMPQLHRQYARTEEGPAENEDPDKMVIRKEVQYSVQFERGEGSKQVSTDATAYV